MYFWAQEMVSDMGATKNFAWGGIRFPHTLKFKAFYRSSHSCGCVHWNVNGTTSCVQNSPVLIFCIVLFSKPEGWFAIVNPNPQPCWHPWLRCITLKYSTVRKNPYNWKFRCYKFIGVSCKSRSQYRSVWLLATGWMTEGWMFESQQGQEFSLLHVDLLWCPSNPSCQVGTGGRRVFPWGIVPRSRKHESIHQLPPYVFME
jgi:hypothetical protein